MSWFAQRDVGPCAKREWSDENDNDFGSVITTAADHEAGKVEVGPRCVGRMHDRNGVGISPRITRAHKAPLPRQLGTGALLFGASGLTGVGIGAAGGGRRCTKIATNRTERYLHAIFID